VLQRPLEPKGPKMVAQYPKWSARDVLLFICRVAVSELVSIE
jgi:hypothetical protein